MQYSIEILTTANVVCQLIESAKANGLGAAPIPGSTNGDSLKVNIFYDHPAQLFYLGRNFQIEIENLEPVL